MQGNRRNQIENFLMIGAGFMFFAIALTLLSILFNEDWAKRWDVLAFLGSIIGGLLTLFGVRVALDNQRKDDFINRFPERLLCIDNIMQEIYDRQHEIGLGLIEKSIHETMNAVYEFLQREEEIKKKSIIAGADVYDHVLKVFRALRKMEGTYRNEIISADDTMDQIQLERRTLNDPLNALLQIKGRLLKQYSAHHD